MNVEAERACAEDVEALRQDGSQLAQDVIELQRRFDLIVDRLTSLAVNQANLINVLNNTRWRRFRRWVAHWVYSGELIRESS